MPKAKSENSSQVEISKNSFQDNVLKAKEILDTNFQTSEKIRKKRKVRPIILFVDDEEKSVKYFEKMFSDNFRIIGAGGVKEAIDALEKYNKRIAIIVSDQRMPNQTGVELLKFSRERYPYIVRILTTAYADLEDNIAAINEGKISAYITKPWKIDEIKIALENAVAEHKSNMILLSLSGSIAHEVRNPLNLINISLAKIHNHIHEEEVNGDTYLDKETVEMIDDMIEVSFSSIKRANEIIDLTLENIRGKEIDASRFTYLSAKEIIEKTIKEYGYKADSEREKITVNIDENFIIHGNETLIIYSLFNLIKNALHYIDKKPESKIIISTNKVEDFNQIIVYDEGPGIAKDKIGSIFDAFYTSGKKGGTGLGLAFCKRVMHNLDGEIDCESELDKYTKFILSFPIITEEELKEYQEENIDPKTKVLIVDDQEVNLMVTRRIIENGIFSNKFSCEVAFNGKEALEKFLINRHDIVIMDLQMPVMDGITAIQEIRKINPDVPIIAHTSLSQDFRRSLIENDINYYIKKPAKKGIILKAVCSWSAIKYDPLEKLNNQEIKNLLRNKRILLADDENVNLSLFSKYLTNFNAKVDQSKNGKELFENFTNNKKTDQPYDLIITDIEMPELNGILASKRIREFEFENNFENTPIIAFSGNSEKEKIHQILSSGINDYFIKGDDHNYLLRNICFWLQPDL